MNVTNITFTYPIMFKSNQVHPSQGQAKPCPVCIAAGVPREQAIGHFPKNDLGETVCNTLLTQQCGYCLAFGHTPKYCAQAKANRKSKAAVAPRRQEPKEERVSFIERGFNLLRDDSSDEECPFVLSPTKPTTVLVSVPKHKRTTTFVLAPIHQQQIIPYAEDFPKLSRTPPLKSIPLSSHHGVTLNKSEPLSPRIAQPSPIQLRRVIPIASSAGYSVAWTSNGDHNV